MKCSVKSLHSVAWVCRVSSRIMNVVQPEGVAGIVLITGKSVLDEAL